MRESNSLITIKHLLTKIMNVKLGGNFIKWVQSLLVAVMEDSNPDPITEIINAKVKN